LGAGEEPTPGRRADANTRHATSPPSLRAADRLDSLVTPTTGDTAAEPDGGGSGSAGR
jgi:hypothetical protein